MTGAGDGVCADHGTCGRSLRDVPGKHSQVPPSSDRCVLSCKALFTCSLSEPVCNLVRDHG